MRVGQRKRMQQKNIGSTIRSSNGTYETVVENPYGLVDYAGEEFHPPASLLYGPAYLCVAACHLVLTASQCRQISGAQF